MTGIYELFINHKKVKDFELLPEVFDDILEWYFKAQKNDSVLIRCEQPT
jgi:hypothetical protein